MKDDFCMLGLDFFLCVYLGFYLLCVLVVELRSFRSCIVCFYCVWFSLFSTKPRDWLGTTCPK